jgi:Flp pilus assembly protein TadD
MGDLWIQALTRNQADLVALDNEFRRKVVAEDVNGYEMEIERHPKDAGLQDTAALLYLELGRVEPAVAHFQKALAIKGPSAPAHYNLGTALTVGRQFDQAVYEYQQAIRIDPGYAPAHNNLGNVYLAQGKVDEAIAEFREVVRLQPDSSTAKANLAAALGRKPQPR